MDYHFARPANKQDSGGADLKKLIKLIKRFIPLLLLAAFLPFLIGFVVAPPAFRFSTQADEPAELRIWLEPTNVMASVGTTVEFSVWAQFDTESRLIPAMSLSVSADDNLGISQGTLEHNRPFSGRIKLGEVYVTAQSAGAGQVFVNRDSIIFTAFDDEITINTGHATVFVQ